jgi:hypothetical protein
MSGQIIKTIVLIGLAFAVGACSDTVIRDGKIGSTSALYTSADVRVVTERPHPTLYGRTIICTEPSPDVAKALSTAFQLSGKGASGPEGALNVASAEAAAELAGRSTALLGLRDGLYKTCEAYANGAIGDLAYLLVLNRYGQLVATLFLGQDIQPSAAAASIQSPALNLGGSAQTGSNTKSGSQQGSPTGSGGSPAAADTTTTADLAQGRDPSKLIRLATATADSPASPSASQGKNKQGGGAQKSGNTPGQQPAAGTMVSADLTKMQEQYLGLDNPSEMLHLLLVACLEEFDPSRPVAEGVQHNPLLQQNCQPLFAGIVKRCRQLLGARENRVICAPLNPQAKACP